MLVSEAREKNEERTRIGKQSKGSQLQVRRMSIIAFLGCSFSRVFSFLLSADSFSSDSDDVQT